MTEPTPQELHRDQVERDLYEKPEIHEERRHNLVIRVYWLRLTNQISLQLTDESRYPPHVQEDIIPNDQVNDAISHPTLRFPKQRRYYGDDA